MNQSNKALRDALGKIRIGVGLDKETYLDNTEITQTLALVTNHIKGALPKEKVAHMPNYPDKEEIATFYEELGFNQALDEVSQILKEMGE